jgi:hypothetical protein
MTWLYVAAGLGIVFVLALLLAGAAYADYRIARFRRRWVVYRLMLTSDLRMLREGLRLALAHWRQTRVVLDAADEAVRPQAEGRE